MYKWTHAFKLEVFNGHIISFLKMSIFTKETELCIICAKLIIENKFYIVCMASKIYIIPNISND